jgi:hypothetical protein
MSMKSPAHYYCGAFRGEEAVSKASGITKAMVDATSAKEKWRTVSYLFQIYVNERQRNTARRHYLSD